MKNTIAPFQDSDHFHEQYFRFITAGGFRRYQKQRQAQIITISVPNNEGYSAQGASLVAL